MLLDSFFVGFRILFLEFAQVLELGRIRTRTIFDIFAPIPHVFSVVTDIFPAIADILAPILHIFSPVLHIFSAILAVLPTIGAVFNAIFARRFGECLRGATQESCHDNAQQPSLHHGALLVLLSKTPDGRKGLPRPTVIIVGGVY
ncbi:MAG: hypothetical protein HY737_01680 [Candidatus Omnitrophica bacterium]|nr:hypothetical protein [Candidatus Omnitrophota bacterium]